MSDDRFFRGRGAPGNLQSLRARLQRVVRAGEDRGADELAVVENRVVRAMANVIVGQTIPNGVIKGGTAMNIRLGTANSRFTPDLDAARLPGMAVGDYLEELAANLAQGWQGFTGVVEEDSPADPVGVPDAYVMQPFRIRLAYAGRHWLSVRFELGHDEIGSTLAPEMREADDLAELLSDLGFEERPRPMPLLPVAHQVAQKLHACTSMGRGGGNDRAHDLVDLQLLDLGGGIATTDVKAVAQRLFISRRAQPWPPTVVAYDRWPDIYAEAADGLGVRPDVTDAVDWANDLIQRIASAHA
ncbi:nucleotidyl transferase AbiEii/AbiGii toxin family protein [soil metagenome]